MRQIVLDTETTGLEPQQGHRIIEIGCVELVDRRPTGRRFHKYLNPEREIDAGAVEIHGLTNEFLADKPLFSAVVDELFEFISGAELVIHNAPFDVGFLNAELTLLGRKSSLTDVCTVLDTLTLARARHPGQRNSLDALCKRYMIDNSQRSLHGALLDAEILTDLYLAMTGGQTALLLGGDTAEARDEASTSSVRRLPQERSALRVVMATEAERAAHERQLAAIDKSSNGKCIWLAAETSAK